MKKTLNADWALRLSEMSTKRTEIDDAVRKIKIAQMVEYVQKETDGSFQLDRYSEYIVQKKVLPWSYIFEVIKNAPKFGFVIMMTLPPRFRIKTPDPASGKMYAYYISGKDAVKLLTYTDERRDNRVGYDGFSMEPDEIEVVEGLRDRNGNWIE